MMSAYLTTSETILDSLAEGADFEELQEMGYSKDDLLTAALFGVAELHEEYKELSKKYSFFKDYDIW